MNIESTTTILSGYFDTLFSRIKRAFINDISDRILEDESFWSNHYSVKKVKLFFEFYILYLSIKKTGKGSIDFIQDFDSLVTVWRDRISIIEDKLSSIRFLDREEYLYVQRMFVDIESNKHNISMDQMEALFSLELDSAIESREYHFDDIPNKCDEIIISDSAMRNFDSFVDMNRSIERYDKNE